MRKLLISSICLFAVACADEKASVCACDDATVQEACETSYDACDGDQDCVDALETATATLCEAASAGDDAGEETE